MSREHAALLEPGFLFSQHSLNTYQQCPRRFLLRYIERQPWPVPEDAAMGEYQERLARGRTLHLWMARQQLGIDMAPTVAACQDAELAAWWRAAQRFDWDALPSAYRQPELPLVVPLGDYRLYARYDLLAYEPGRAVIVDWKTLETRPRERTLQQRLQTRVYLYCLAAAAEVVAPNAHLTPEALRMVYWFTNFAEDPGVVEYGSAQFQRDGERLRALAHEIATQPREAFEPTPDLRRCGYCLYRTLCERESVPDSSDETWLDEEIDFTIDRDDVPDGG